MTPEQRNVYEQAISAQQNNEFGTALVCFQKLLEVAKNEDKPHLNYLVGSCLLQMGDLAQARLHLHEAVNVSDPQLDAINNLGVCYKALGQIEIAEKIFKGIASRITSYVPALLNLAEIREQQDNLEEACLWYELACRHSKDDFELLLRFVVCLQKTGQYSAARQLILDTLPRIPSAMQLEYYEALTNLDFQLKDYPAAKKTLQDLVCIDPHHAQAWCNLAWVCEHLGEFQQAIEAATKATELTPEMTQGWNNLGLAYRAAHDLRNAEKSFLHGLSIQSDELITFNLGTTYLLEGNYTAGWEGYEHRFRLGATQAPFVDAPIWSGESLSERRLLVYADQGYGDDIQFSRFLKGLAPFNPKSISFVVPQPLRELMTVNFPDVEVYAEDEDLPEVDEQIAVSSLPSRLDVTIENLPDFHKVWIPPQQAVQTWQTWASEQPSNMLKVGINWMGNPNQTRDYLRSCRWEIFSTLFDIKNTMFYALSVDPRAKEQVAELGHNQVVDLGPRLRDFSHTAAAVSQMDLIITIDSALAHLSGSLNAKTWVLLSHTPDWRWHLERTDSPWYPSLSLYRQTSWNDWTSLINTVRDDLTRESQRKPQA